MTHWNNLPNEIKGVIVRVTVASLAHDCESQPTSWPSCSPAHQLGSFRSILLTNHEFYYLAVNIRISGVSSMTYFQTRQKEMISNLFKYARSVGDFPCPFLDYRDIEHVAGSFWQNPLIYRDFELVNLVLAAFMNELTPRLLCYMKRFFEANLEQTQDRFTFQKSLGTNEPLRPGRARRQLTITTGNLRIKEGYNRKIFSIADIKLSPPVGPNERGQWTTEYAQIKQNLSSWVYVDFDENDEFPNEWYLVNYKEQCVYDQMRIGFERGAEIQQAIERWRVETINH